MPGDESPAGLLDRIVAQKKREIEGIGSIDPSGFPPFRSSFHTSLKRAAGDPVRVIAECKKASPSKGLLRADYDPRAIASTYAHLGASAVSVLTDREFFQGDLSHLPMALECGLPVIRKDFIISEKQILEARAAGAHAILLIVRILSFEELKYLQDFAWNLGLDVLVETHDREEIGTALEARSNIIGINHRNLDTLVMDLSLTEQMAPLIRKESPEAVIIAESGVENREGRKRVDPHVDGILIGSALMESSDPAATWKAIFQD